MNVSAQRAVARAHAGQKRCGIPTGILREISRPSLGGKLGELNPGKAKYPAAEAFFRIELRFLNAFPSVPPTRFMLHVCARLAQNPEVSNRSRLNAVEPTLGVRTPPPVPFEDLSPRDGESSRAVCGGFEQFRSSPLPHHYRGSLWVQ
jgi:hypothetical protein